MKISTNNWWMIQQRLAGVAKQYRKYFRFRARNHFSIFQPFSEKHREKNVKNCQNRLNMSSTMWNESNNPYLRKKISRLRKTFFFLGKVMIRFLWNSTGTSEILQKKIRYKIFEHPSLTGSWIFSLIRVGFYW